MNDIYYSTGGTNAAALATIMSLYLLIAVGSYVISSWFLAGVFKKMGEEQWKAWVPFYNYWVFLEWGGFKGAWLLIILASFIPFIGGLAGIALTVLLAIAAYNIGKGFNKDGVWVVLYIFLSIVWTGILAFDSSRYEPSLNPKSLRRAVR